MKTNINIICDVINIKEIQLLQMIRDWIMLFPEEIKLLSININGNLNEKE